MTLENLFEETNYYDSISAIGYRFAATRRAGVSPQMLIKRTKVSFTTNLSLEHKTPSFG
jgi:hypothetical protein